MSLVPSNQSQPTPALDDIFGSKGQVGLLRILAKEDEGIRASSEVAGKAGLSPSGARKALRRLVDAGLVEKVGNGRATRYLLKNDSPLAGEIVRLFESERQAVGSSWAREPRQRESRGRAKGNGGAEAPWAGAGGPEPRPAGNGGAPGNGKNTGNGNGNGAGSHTVAPEAEKTLPVRLDPANPDIHSAVATLLEEELSLLRRARQRVLEKLEHRHQGNGHDLWEWRKVLDTYPLPRLLHFMESTSPLAVRLRKSSPFVEVMSEREKARLSELIERVH
jgi:DNA-binding MarR family transcriptional regulator